ncbi:hypothetical protein Ancab_006420, partial [Ancistrocladus abbreviatus]
LWDRGERDRDTDGSSRTIDGGGFKKQLRVERRGFNGLLTRQLGYYLLVWEF